MRWQFFIGRVIENVVYILNHLLCGDLSSNAASVVVDSLASYLQSWRLIVSTMNKLHALILSLFDFLTLQSLSRSLL